MTETVSPVAKAEIRATHFSPEGKPLLNPSLESPKATQPERRGVLRFIDGLRGRVPEIPEGPKHVLESLEVMALANRQKRVVMQWYLAETGRIAYNPDTNLGYGPNSTPVIDLAVIEARRAERARKTGENPPAPLVEIPQSLNQIITTLYRAAGLPEDVSVDSLMLGKSGTFLIIKTDKGINIRLNLPDPGSNSGFYFSIDAQSLGSNPELIQQVKAIETQFSDKTSLLGICEALIQYAEQGVAKLPEENAIRKLEVQEERETNRKMREERDRAKAAREQSQRSGVKRELSDKEKRALERLRKRHPNNPLFKEPWSPETLEGSFVEVFSFVPENALEPIGEQGLRPNRPDDTAEDEAFMEAHMPEGIRSKFPTLSRKNSVFAHPDSKESAAFRYGIALSIIVDPDRAFVVDAQRYTEAIIIRSFVHAEHYWENAITLREYLALSPEEKKRFEIPEVLIPGGVKPENIRIDHVTGKPYPT